MRTIDDILQDDELVKELDDLMADNARLVDQYADRIETNAERLWDGVPDAESVQMRMLEYMRPVYHEYLGKIKTVQTCTDADVMYGMLTGSIEMLYRLGIMDRDAYLRVGDRAFKLIVASQQQRLDRSKETEGEDPV